MVVGQAGNKNKISSEDNGQKGLIPVGLNDNSELASMVVSDASTGEDDKYSRPGGKKREFLVEEQEIFGL
jgi:hypothetical protein